MRDIIMKLNKAAELYYNYGTSPLTDKEYDTLLQQLKEEEKRTGIIYSNSPTQKVGAPILNEQKKIDIIDRPMLSLEKVYSQTEIDNFINGQDVVRMVKCDGLSVRIVYENGNLFSANTRGNGFVGQDITEHIKHFKNVPLTISYNKRFVIDGEAVILDSDFKQLEGFSNSRNTAAGTLNLLDMKEVKKRKLSFIAWDVIDGKNGLDYLTQVLSFADKLGFQICPHSLTATNEEIREKAIRQGIPQDGVVWRYNNLAYGESLGKTAHHWNYACAYKFPDEVYPTTLKYIEFTMGRTGQLTPVAVYEDVEIDGTICNRASLHNLTIMDEILGTPYEGQKINVIKSNQIIPQIHSAEKWDFRSNPVINTICIPTECPICGQPLKRVMEVESEVLTCVNESCEGRLINQLDHFVSKKGLDIKGLSKATLEKLVDWEWVNEPADLYHLNEHRAEWIDKPGFGQKSVDKILQAIEVSRYVMLSDFLSAIGIPQIGKVLTKEICKYIDDYQDFRDKINNKWDFTTIDGIAVEKQYSLLNFDYTKADKVAKEMASWGTTASTEIDSTLENMTIVITGHLNKFNNREAFINEIVNHGGKVVNSVSRNTDILINNDITSSSSKNRTAKELGVKILTEKDFCEKYLQI